MAASAGGHLGATPGASPIEVEPGVVDLEAEVIREAIGDGSHVRLVNVLDAAAARARQMVVVGGPAGDVRVHVTVELEASGNACIDEALHGAEDRRPTDRRLYPADGPEQLVGRQLPPGGREVIGDEDPLASDALTGCGEPRWSVKDSFRHW